MLSEEGCPESAVPVESGSVFTPLKLKSGFDAVKNGGKRFVCAFFIMLFLPDRTGTKRNFGIICSRKFDKRAVKRNRARRLLRESVRRLNAENPGAGTLLLIPKRKILEVKAGVVAEALFQNCRKAGILKGMSPCGNSLCRGE